MATSTRRSRVRCPTTRTSTGKSTSRSSAYPFEKTDPRRRREGRPRRARSRREGRGTRTARRGNGSDLHRRAPDSRAGRRDRATGGRRRDRPLVALGRAPLHLPARQRADEGEGPGRRPSVRRGHHPGGRLAGALQGRRRESLPSRCVARGDHEVRARGRATKTGCGGPWGVVTTSRSIFLLIGRKPKGTNKKLRTITAKRQGEERWRKRTRDRSTRGWR